MIDLPDFTFDSGQTRIYHAPLAFKSGFTEAFVPRDIPNLVGAELVESIYCPRNTLFVTSGERTWVIKLGHAPGWDANGSPIEE